MPSSTGSPLDLNPLAAAAVYESILSSRLKLRDLYWTESLIQESEYKLLNSFEMIVKKCGYKVGCG